MTELVQSQHFAPMMVALVIFSIPLAAIIGHYWSTAAKAKSEIELKRLMVEQGRSVEEIERILSADASGCRKSGSKLPAASQAQPDR